MAAEVEGDGEVAADVVEAAGEPLGDLAEQEIVAVETCSRTIAVAAHRGTVEQVHGIAHDATMARRRRDRKGPLRPVVGYPILIPPALREHAGLEREVVIAGVGDVIEIWDKGRFDEDLQRTQSNLDEISSAVSGWERK